MEIIEAQRRFFMRGATKDLDFRRFQLKRLLDAIGKWEKPLYEALKADLNKSYEEAYLTEVSIVKGEILTQLRNLKRWARRQRVGSPMTIWPSSSYIVTEPIGNVLIIAPWNYPFQLLISPLAGAIAAGCTAVLKPSPYAPNVTRVLQDIMDHSFDKEYISLIQGHRDVNEALLKERFDLIFFTGGPALGRTVMEAAAKNLTPVILELGGKSPCIVDKDADIASAARRIAWGKTLNCGQTCIAPDYLLLHTAIKDRFIEEFKKAVRDLHGGDPAQSGHYVRMINDKAFNRVSAYLHEGTIVAGGHTNKASRYIEPTLLDHVDADASVMTEEIFGPVFPIMEFSDIKKAVDFINKREKPLALYFFGKASQGWEVVGCTSSGGACINDTIMHIANASLPFGGVGNSGMGHYHGKESFLAFSHRRSVLNTPAHFDMPFRYMPYRHFKWVKKLLK